MGVAVAPAAGAASSVAAAISASSASAASKSWSGGRMTGISAALPKTRGAVTGGGSSWAVAGGGNVALAESASLLSVVPWISLVDGLVLLRLSRRSGACTVQISMRNFMPKKLTLIDARNAVEMTTRKPSSAKTPRVSAMHAKPSPMAIIAIV